jgi:hypothetical protein
VRSRGDATTRADAAILVKRWLVARAVSTGRGRRGGSRRYQAVEEEGIHFLFAFDPDAPDLLHIFARHTRTIDDALDTFFDPVARTAWNEQRRRFETYSDSHGLFCFWAGGQEGQTVFVITCFRL